MKRKPAEGNNSHSGDFFKRNLCYIIGRNYVKDINRYIGGLYELSHLEMVSVMVHQLTRNLSVDQIKGTPFEAYYVDHTTGIWPQAAGGIPFNACEFQSKGDAITDLVEDLAAEQKARSTYDNLIRLTDDADVLEPLRFLRQREIVHFQRFGEALSLVQQRLDFNNFYAFNPEFDKKCK